MLPSLENLKLSESEPDHDAVRDEFLRLCGGGGGGGGGGSHPPNFVRWGSSSEKRAFRVLVDESENDRFSAGQYETPYSGTDVDEVLRTRTWSIEHIVPRSDVNGRSPGLAENDVFGWDLATRRANARRSNLPLVLWPTSSDSARGVVTIDGEPHFNPPEEFKARLARRWLYIRIVYSKIDRLDRPSRAQAAHADATIELVRTSPSYAEKRLHALLVERVRAKYGVGWRNPLVPLPSERVAPGLALLRDIKEFVFRTA